MGRKRIAEMDAMRECREEAERFINKLPMLNNVSKQEKQLAIDKIGRALWEIKQAQMKLNEAQ